MYRHISIFAIIFLSFLAVSCTASAEDCLFGTKVLPGDYDIGRLIKNVPDNAITGFWDIGPNPDVYDEEDIVYLDFNPIGIINTNDIRLAAFGDHPAGSKVTPFDNDIGKRLTQFKFPSVIGYLNLKGSEYYDLEDPVYLHQNSIISLNEAKPHINLAEEDCDGFVNYDSDSCWRVPKGATRITFKDSYNVIVPEKIANPTPEPYGYCDEKEVEVIKGTSGYYYHILDTNKLKVVGADLLKKMVLLDKYIAANTKDINNLTDAVNYISATSQQTITNDIRLNSIGSNNAGTKVVDFDPDHNKLISPWILITFPRDESNLGALRFYDQNGNGLYDAPDDVYIDISFPGRSSSGQVAINDIRFTIEVCGSKMD